MSMIQGLMYGVFITGGVFTLIGACVFMFIAFLNAKQNKLFIIHNISGGKYDVEYRRGYIKNHEKLGRVYYIPSKKKENLQYAQIFGNEYEYPTHKNKIRAVPLFCDGQKYVPASFKELTDKEVETLQKVEKVINVKGKDKVVVDYETVKKTVTTPIMQPISSDQVSFYLREREAVASETAESLGLLAKYGNVIMVMGTVMACTTMFVVTIIFLYQMSQDGGSQAPEWVKQFIATAESTQAPPQ